MAGRPVWDLVVIGAGPAGAATALGALRAEPGLSVALLDREDFPRDKPCGDGIAPQAIDLLAAAGVTGVVDDQVPVQRLSLRRGELSVDRTMARAAWVIPRRVFDHRLVLAAQAAGASLLRYRVRSLDIRPQTVLLDDDFEARVVVGADGPHSVVRRSLGLKSASMALALRGYAPTPPGRAGMQLIVFGTNRQPSYAWSFDRGDGFANVGYGESLTSRRPRPSKAELLAQLDHLLPGAADGGTDWRGHHLPLSSWSWRPSDGRVLLAGDAAGLVNPMTGEGIYYAIATGLLAGASAAAALRGTDGSIADGPLADGFTADATTANGTTADGGTADASTADGTTAYASSSDGRTSDGSTAGARYRKEVRGLLGRHLRHTALAARLCLSGGVLDVGIQAAAKNQRVFDDLVELGLANGRITPRLASSLLTAALPPRGRPTPH